MIFKRFMLFDNEGLPGIDGCVASFDRFDETVRYGQNEGLDWYVFDCDLRRVIAGRLPDKTPDTEAEYQRRVIAMSRASHVP